jgi:hypothetical protein
MVPEPVFALKVDFENKRKTRTAEVEGRRGNDYHLAKENAAL